MNISCRVEASLCSYFDYAQKKTKNSLNICRPFVYSVRTNCTKTKKTCNYKVRNCYLISFNQLCCSRSFMALRISGTGKWREVMSSSAATAATESIFKSLMYQQVGRVWKKVAPQHLAFYSVICSLCIVAAAEQYVFDTRAAPENYWCQVEKYNTQLCTLQAQEPEFVIWWRRGQRAVNKCNYPSRELSSGRYWFTVALRSLCSERQKEKTTCRN